MNNVMTEKLSIKLFGLLTNKKLGLEPKFKTELSKGYLIKQK